ncbi:hypothetical protein [Butyricicoccus sp. AM27-36]|uniref:hypothetical protein n=1 Tax=Butyricicoccus sp. AM27-36 TaxID=2292293 RepID=UPI000E4E69B4|nr:hypothetical protein [Butyricicoccus sp. AM27-36]RHT88912.1 hypothetical protein DW724_04915 [Butyricicoccus sp. AM27-36]
MKSTILQPQHVEAALSEQVPILASKAAEHVADMLPEFAKAICARDIVKVQSIAQTLQITIPELTKLLTNVFREAMALNKEEMDIGKEISENFVFTKELIRSDKSLSLKEKHQLIRELRTEQKEWRYSLSEMDNKRFLNRCVGVSLFTAVLGGSIFAAHPDGLSSVLKTSIKSRNIKKIFKYFHKNSVTKAFFKFLKKSNI